MLSLEATLTARVGRGCLDRRTGTLLAVRVIVCSKSVREKVRPGSVLTTGSGEAADTSNPTLTWLLCGIVVGSWVAIRVNPPPREVYGAEGWTVGEVGAEGRVFADSPINTDPDATGDTAADSWGVDKGLNGCEGK